jgi:hypothetical protein
LGREYYDRGLELLGVGRGVTVRIEGTGMDLLAKTHHFRDPSDFLRVMMEAGQETLHRMGWRQVLPAEPITRTQTGLDSQPREEDDP